MRRITAIAWDMIIAEAEWWQVQMLLADCATRAWAFDVAVQLLEDLVDSKHFPMTEFAKIRRARFYAYKRQHGEEVPGE